MSPLVLACVLMTLHHGLEENETHARDVCETIETIAHNQGLDPWLVAAVAWHESKFSPRRVNPKTGAAGAFQIIPKHLRSDYFPTPIHRTRKELGNTIISTEVAIWLMINWRDGLEYIYKGRWFRTKAYHQKWLACYASGIACKARYYERTVQSYRRDLQTLLAYYERAACQPPPKLTD